MLLLAFAAFMAYGIYRRCWSARLGRGPRRRRLLVDRAVARVVALGGGWLVFLSLKSVFYSVFTGALPYGEPQTWLTIPFWNNFFLMVVLIWIQTGFAMVILSARCAAFPKRPSRRRSSTAPTRSRSSSRSRCRRSWAPSSWSGRRSRWSCSRSSTSSSP
jgi:ABC-type sugar transport system permease subunit